MIQLFISYFLPFIIIYIVFAKLSERFGKATSAFGRIFLAMVIFFGTRFFVETLTIALILSFGSSDDKSDFTKHIPLLQTVFLLIAVAACFTYYNFLKRKFKKENRLRKNSIENIGQ